MVTDQYLVLFDADRIKDYVFATGRLREIRGASERVRQLTDQEILEADYDEWSEEEPRGVIYAGGGGGAILLEGKQRAEQCRRELERRYRQGTKGATLSAVCVPVPSGQADPEAAAQQAAARALARWKESRAQAAEMPGGVARFCASDRLLPASVEVELAADASRSLVSRSTAIKRAMNQEYRKNLRLGEFWKSFIAAMPSDKGSWNTEVDLFQDLGSIGAQAEPAGYIAFVHVDGDHIGSRLAEEVKRGGFAEYRRFSQAVTDAATEAAAQTLAAAYRDHPPRFEAEPGRTPRLVLPFELITIGGDDIMLICTAERGLEIACGICRLFAAKAGPKITASAGVVIAPDSLPIPLLKRASFELLGSAKDQGPGHIDFHIVTTPGLDSIKRIRIREYQTEQAAVLTRRPYRVDEAEALLEKARGLKRAIPNSKIAELYTVCRGERILTALEVLGVHARLGQAGQDALTDALARLDSVAHYPFGPPDNLRYRTALVDLLEVSRYARDPMEAPA